jgi:drug/metabolite transporter (DMT)-like permease
MWMVRFAVRRTPGSRDAVGKGVCVVAGPSLEGHPEVGMAAGALCVSASAVLLNLAGTSPGTASFYRCVLALPALVTIGFAERRREGGPTAAQRGLAGLAGALFAGDMLLWTQAITEVGAGLSTVLVNVQVVLVPLLALLIDHEPLTRRYLLTLPVVLAGVVLTAGIVGGTTVGRDPGLGTVHAILAALCYSGFLYLLRRTGYRGHIKQSYVDVTATAALVSLIAGTFWHGVDLTPGWAAIGWLLAVAAFGQVLGWLLVAIATPHLPSHVGAILLLLTPVGAVLLGALVLGERPSPAQLAGCLLILGGAQAATLRVSATQKR